MKSVAVLMCTYNGAAFLDEQLASIFAQSHGNLALWVSDDGSSDRTMDILDGAKHSQSRQAVHIVAGPRQGFGANFLSLISRPEISADVYTFADQDDIWEVDKVARAVEALAAVPNDMPAVYISRTRLVDEANLEIGLSPEFSRPPAFRNALVQSIGGGNTMAVNRAARDLIASAPTAHCVSHDWWIYMLVTGAGGQMIIDRATPVRYRQHGQNLMGTNLGFRSRLRRLKMLLQGTFKQWTDASLADLQVNRSKLTAENRAVLDGYARIRQQGYMARLLNLQKLGLYRQGKLESIIMTVAMLLGRW